MSRKLTQSPECTKIILKISQFWHFNMSFDESFNWWNIILLHQQVIVSRSGGQAGLVRSGDWGVLPCVTPSQWVRERQIRNGNSVVSNIIIIQTLDSNMDHRGEPSPSPLSSSGWDLRTEIREDISHDLLQSVECPMFCEEPTCSLTIIWEVGMSLCFTDLLSSSCLGEVWAGWWCQTKVVISSQMSYSASVWTGSTMSIVSLGQPIITSNQYLRRYHRPAGLTLEGRWRELKHYEPVTIPRRWEW